MSAAVAKEFPGLTKEVPAWLSEGSANDGGVVSTGTTLVAIEFDGGVVIGADSRTSMGTFVFDRVADKLTPLTDRIYVCRSGSAADTQAVTDIVKYKASFLEIEMGEPIPVHTAAFLFKDICYEYRDQLSAGIIVAGWDKKKGGQVYSIPLGGMMVRQGATMGGSGSTFLYGYLDANYRENLSRAEAEDLVLKCVTLAIHRDGSSGGCCRMAVITEAGVEKKVVLNNELPKHPWN